MVDDDRTLILIDLTTVLEVPTSPPPQIRKTMDNSVIVSSGETDVAKVQAADERDAESIAELLADLIKFAR